MEPDLCSRCALEAFFNKIPAPPCSMCGRDDRMKSLSPTVTDFGRTVLVWVCCRDGIVGMLCLGERGQG